MLKIPFLRFPSLSARSIYSVRTITTDLEKLDLDTPIIEEEIDKQAEIDLEKKRNKSGLNYYHFNMIHGRPPYSEPKHKIHYSVKYQRKLFGKYGYASNVDPRICWMDEKELQDKIEYESILEDKTLPELIKMDKQKKDHIKSLIMKREELLESRIAKNKDWERDLKMRQDKSLAAANAAKEKKERLIEEVRRHFGFKVDPRDERFQEMLAEKEKKQKKEEKEAKKLAKEAKMLARLQQKNAEITS